MNKVRRHITLLICLTWLIGVKAEGGGTLQETVNDMHKEIEACISVALADLTSIDRALDSLTALVQTDGHLSDADKIDMILQMRALDTRKEDVRLKVETDISKIRYIKGVEIIKILYEKILSLDHHFSSVQTFSEINRMTNPNEYPEFQGFRSNLEKNRDQKQGFALTEIVQANPMLSVVSSLGDLLLSNLSSKQKKSEIKEVECILDFTMRMYGDINTIYFETSFLRSNNDELKARVEELFKLYTKPVKYYTDIHECRMNDDWEQLRANLDAYVTDMLNESNDDLRRSKRINIEFPIDRLLEFIDDYNDYIDLSEKFYQKFYTILDSYENEQQCTEKLPFEYAKLKRDVEQSVEKFRVAYKPVEVNGSKLKGILYGINDYN